MNFWLLFYKIVVLFCFAISLDCSVDYISLKKLCHYGDVTVPEETQKKIYGILAPLFSQKPLAKGWNPWGQKIREDAIIDHQCNNGRTVDSRVQALKFILKLMVPYNFPSDLFSIIHEKISPELTAQTLSFIRKYRGYDSQINFVPFLHKNQVWSLESEYARLSSEVGRYEHEQLDVSLKLDVYRVFNGQTFPTAVLKIPSTQDVSKTQQVSSGVSNLVLCLFETGCMSLVDLTSKKVIWHRKYNETRSSFCDSFGYLVTGYKDIVCFCAYRNDRRELKFYTIDQVKQDEEHKYRVANDKFLMIPNDNYITSSVLNLRFFFYTFCKYKSKDGCFCESPSRTIFKGGGQDFNRYLYYVSYTNDQSEEKILLTLDNVNNFFVCLSCNDTCLIARDKQKKLYVFDIQNEPFTLKNTIQDDEKILYQFWLDPDSEKILTQNGIFKIQDVFGDLQRLNFGTSETAKPAISRKRFTVKYGFLRGVFMRLYWFMRSWYWTIKNGLYWSGTFVLRRFV